MSHKLALPRFKDLDLDNFTVKLDNLLQESGALIDSLLTENSTFTWDNLLAQLDDIFDCISKQWAPLQHMHAVVNSPELRACYEASQPLLTAWYARLSHNEALYNAVKSIDTAHLLPVQQKLVADELRDFELAGVALPAEQKQRFEEIALKLSEFSNRFVNNIMDCEAAFSLHLPDDTRLKGLPSHTLHHAAAIAAERDLAGFVLTLEAPVFTAVMTHAEDRGLREEIYTAWVTRASDEGPLKDQFDNTDVMNEILALRHEKARLLGFENFAELSLARKMADSTSRVLEFLEDLRVRAFPQAQAEMAELKEFARHHYQLSEVKPWDITWLSEKKREREHNISEAAIREYFPLPRVLGGLFQIIQRLFGVEFREVANDDTWHKEVRCFELYSAEDELIGYLYMDLFARAHKRSGAWMDDMQSRRRLQDGSMQLPIATLTCNFTHATGDKPALLSHDEVITLFHETGHCLHHLLTRVEFQGASGINGVEWDAVELPSQFLENWCWERDAIGYLTAHVDTGATIDADLFAGMLAAKNFQSAMAMVRQLEFSLFDFRIHREYQPDADFIGNTLAKVRKLTAVTPLVPWNRFAHSFSHIFAGGYAAGYYSYKWAEVLSSDAFSRFEENGIFDPRTGQDFLHEILEVGGSRKAAQSFEAFRGRPATVDALLRHNGIGVTK